LKAQIVFRIWDILKNYLPTLSISSKHARNCGQSAHMDSQI